MYLHGKYSKTFAQIGVRDIGRRSDSMLTIGLTFGKGVMLAVFHKVGTYPSRIEQLTIEAMGRESISQNSL